MHAGVHVVGVGLPEASAWLGLAVLMLSGLGLFWLICVLMSVRLLTRPPRRTYASALARGKPGDPSELDAPRAFRAWTFEHGGAHLPVWDIEGDQNNRASAPICVMVHGWGDSKLGALPRLPGVMGWARSVVAFDLPGHGESSSGGTTLGVRDPDVVAALVQRGVPAGSPVVLLGWSLGAGAAIAAARKLIEQNVRVVGVIAENPYRVAYTPARNVLRFYAMPWRFNLGPALALVGLRLGVGHGRGGRAWRGFDRVEHAAGLRCPLLVLAGEQDVICPPEDGRQIAAVAPAGTFRAYPGKGHNDLWSGDVTGLVSDIAGWVGDLAPARPPA